MGIKIFWKMWVSIFERVYNKVFWMRKEEEWVSELTRFYWCRPCPSCPVWAIIMPIREKSFRKNFLLRGASNYLIIKRKALQIVSNSKYYIIKLFDYQSIIHSNISIIKVISIKTFWYTNYFNLKHFDSQSNFYFEFQNILL